MPGGTWPNSVVTGDQNAYGSGWEIGAFVYVPAVAPPSNLQAVGPLSDAVSLPRLGLIFTPIFGWTPGIVSSAPTGHTSRAHTNGLGPVTPLAVFKP